MRALLLTPNPQVGRLLTGYFLFTLMSILYPFPTGYSSFPRCHGPLASPRSIPGGDRRAGKGEVKLCFAPTHAYSNFSHGGCSSLCGPASTGGPGLGLWNCLLLPSNKMDHGFRIIQTIFSVIVTLCIASASPVECCSAPSPFTHSCPHELLLLGGEVNDTWDMNHNQQVKGIEWTDE